MRMSMILKFSYVQDLIMHKLNLLALATFICIHQVYAATLPSGFNNIHGDASIHINADNNSMTIVSNNKNNILSWKDFSIGAGNKVVFDSNNYLNIVKGPNISKIAGTLSAAGNIIIVNPNGITLEKGGSFHVNNLTLSTAKILDQEIEDYKRTGNLTITNKGMGRVILAGKSFVKNIEINGSQIIIRDLEEITDYKQNPLTNQDANHIKLTSSTNRIDIGGANSINFNDYNFTNLEGLYDHRGQIAISTAEEFLNINNNLSGSYFLTNDLELNLTESLGGEFGFSGNLDGAFNQISYTLNYQKNSNLELNLGLFNQLYNATIQNLLLKDCLINLNTDANEANLGALAGKIYGGKLKNIEVQNFKINPIDTDISMYNLGALTGKLSANVNNLATLDNVITSFNQDNEALLANSANLGSIIGVVQDDFIKKSTVLGLSSNNLNPIGKNNGKTVIDSDTTFQSYLLKTDIGFSLKAFYNPFYVENFEFDYDENKSYHYSDLTNTTGFDINELIDIEPDNKVSEAGTYNYLLQNKTDKDRNFYFVSDSDLAIGNAIIKINGKNTSLPDNPSDEVRPNDPQPTTRLNNFKNLVVALNDEKVACKFCHNLVNQLIQKQKLSNISSLGSLKINIQDNNLMTKLIENYQASKQNQI